MNKSMEGDNSFYFS